MKIVIRDIDSSKEWIAFEKGKMNDAWTIRSIIRQIGLYDSESLTHYSYNDYQLVGKEPDVIFEIIVTPEGWEE